MALTISGSGGGITASEVIALRDNWTTLATFNCSATPANASTTSSQYAFSDTAIMDVPNVNNYELIRVRVKGGTMTSDRYGTSGSLRLWLFLGANGSATTDYSSSSVLLFDTGVQSTSYSVTFDGTEGYYALIENRGTAGFYIRNGSSGLQLTSSKCITYAKAYNKSTSISVQVVVEGKNPIVY